MQALCRVCGLGFSAKRKDAKSCSDACRRIWNDTQARERYKTRHAPKQRTCACGTVFVPQTNQVHCSKGCREQASKQRSRDKYRETVANNQMWVPSRASTLVRTSPLQRELTCDYCGVVFFKLYGRDKGSARLCSKSCRSQYSIRIASQRARDRFAAWTERVCITCGVNKPKADYLYGNAYRKKCRVCRQNEQTPETKRRYHLQDKFGITLEEWLAIYDAQNGACAICTKKLPPRESVFESQKRLGKRNTKNDWHTDHCHHTGKVRGILCGGCNRAIGQFDDTPSKLRLAINYLERHRVCTHIVCATGPAGLCSLSA